MPNQVETLIHSTLNLEQLEINLFRGHGPQDGWVRIYGGQVVAQALTAAYRTVDEDRIAHSLHGYFMLGGDPSIPVIYDVDRIRDGKSFTTRRVVAIQHGKAIFSLSVSFSRAESGLDHYMDMPQDIPQPEELLSPETMTPDMMHAIPDRIRQYWQRERPIEMRAVKLDHYISDKKLAPEQYIWLKATSPIESDDLRLHQTILAYASDMTLLDTSLFPHGLSIFSDKIMPASLDHSLWFHRDFRMDDWLLYAQDSPSSSGSRGFTRGNLYTRDGLMVASATQEGLIRLKTR